MKRKIFCLFCGLVLFWPALIFAVDSPAGVDADSVEVSAGKFSFDLKGIDILELLKIISLKSHTTIVPTKGVTGRVNLYLNGVVFADLLDILATAYDLAYVQEKDIIYFMSAAEYTAKYGRDFSDARRVRLIKFNNALAARVLDVAGQLKSDIGKISVDSASGILTVIDTPEKIRLIEQAVQTIDAPLETAVFDINYSDAAKLSEYVNLFLTPDVGRIVYDQTSHKLAVTDLPEAVKKVRMLVTAFDEAVRQVLIKARIVQVNLDKGHASGIDWQAIAAQYQDLTFTGEFSNSEAETKYGQISMATLSEDNYHYLLNALASQGSVRIVSTPTLLAVDGQEANIMVGTREAYVTQTLSQGESTTVTSEAVEFIDVGTKLVITPRISKDDFITMTVKPELSEVSETLTTSSGSVIPIVSSSEAQTAAKVKNGATVMVAGLGKVKDTSTVKNIPLLAKIPILGGLTGSDTKTAENVELLVFLTPQIVIGDEKE